MPCTDVKSRVGNNAERWGQTNNDVKHAGAQGEMQREVGKTISMLACTKFDFKFKTHYKDHLHPMSDPAKPRAENSFAVHTQAAHFAARPEDSALQQH